LDETTKAQRSLKNFRRLFEKHPELLHVARRWAASTYRDILQWGGAGITDTNPDKQFLDNYFKLITPYPFFIRPTRKLKILTYRWHCPHQYELYKLPHHFTLVVGLDIGLTNEWEYEQRPFPGNAEFKHIKDIDCADYDLAILHFDENVLAHQNTNGIIGANWGANFRWFCENVALPKVAICHGTPQFHSQFSQKYIPCDQIETIEESRRQLVDYVDDMLIICNSYQAQREWGFQNSKVIWQGFDPTEFPPALYEKGILTLGKSMQERPHYRGYFLYQDVFKGVADEYLPQGHNVPKPTAYLNQRTNLYAWSKFRNYVDSVRAYSIYFNPTWRSPMPRARGEAMMCGLVPVSAHNHDVDMFIKNGINGYYSNDPAELRDYMLFLLKNPDACRKTGYEARMTAMDVFNHDQYLWSWQETIRQLIGDKHV
jgi:glycosyltransferase involved in cell wall biosynthesis